MSARWRILSYGSAAVLVVAGAACAATVGGLAGQLLAIILIGVGLIMATALVFLEVGLSEDRERAETARVQASARAEPRPQGRPARIRRLKRPDLGRSRGHRRRLG